jgi:hypothetical protein
VQQVHPAPRLLGEREQPLRGEHRALDVADLVVARHRRVGAERRVALLEPRLVLAVHGDAARARAQHALERLVVGDQ